MGRKEENRGSRGLIKYFCTVFPSGLPEMWMLSNLNPLLWKSQVEGLWDDCPHALHFKPFFSSFFFFDVVTPNLLLHWQTNERPVHGWQLISLAGGKQLDTANRGWRGSDMKSMRQSCICGQEGVCESISKIIHFPVATHFRLPVPITDVSGERDRAGHGVAGGRFCLICHQRPGDPHSLSYPPFTYSSHLLLYSSSSPHPCSAGVACITIKGGAIVTPNSRFPLCPSFPLQLGSEYTNTHENY